MPRKQLLETYETCLRGSGNLGRGSGAEGFAETNINIRNISFKIDTNLEQNSCRRVMHGCKPCRAVYLLFGCVQEQRTAINQPILVDQGGVIPHPFLESEETKEKTAEKALVKDLRGVFCAVKGSNLRNDELGHASTWLPTSSNFILCQFSTGLDTWNSKIEACNMVL